MNKVAVIVPGIGYTTDRSLLYFAGKEAQNDGFELIKIRFSGFEKGIKGDQDKMKRAMQHAYGQLIDQLPAIDKSDDVLFISKSIGTAVSLQADMEKDIRARHILFTPLMETMTLIERLLKKQGKSRKDSFAVFHGLDDPWAPDNGRMYEMSLEMGLDHYSEVMGANHSLETGRPSYDMRIQASIIESCHDFLKK